MIEVAILNTSTVVPEAEISAVVDALQIQVSRDFAPLWGIDAKLIYVKPGDLIPQKTSQLVILDDSDSAEYLGFHDLTPDGYPLGKVFARSTIQDKGQWTVTLSHELLEMLADPSINLVVEADDAKGHSVFYAYEVCDAVEGDEFGYPINGIQVSNFVTPAYFETFHKGDTQYDFRRLLKQCIPAMLDGGYLSLLNTSNGKGWTQISAQLAPGNRARIGSRRERRRTPRADWLLSKSV